MSELTKEEREKENLVKEIEIALQELVSTEVCPLPIPTPEAIRARNKSLKNIADAYFKK